MSSSLGPAVIEGMIFMLDNNCIGFTVVNQKSRPRLKIKLTRSAGNCQFRDDGDDGRDCAGNVVAENDGVGVARRQNRHETVQTVLVNSGGGVQDYHRNHGHLRGRVKTDTKEFLIFMVRLITIMWVQRGN